MKIYHYPSPAAEKKVSAIVNRSLNFKRKDYQAVSRILEDVRRNGDEAVIKYANRFDAPKLTVESIKVTAGETEAALKKVDRSFVRAINRAASQIEAFHRQQVQQSWIDTQRTGTMLGQLVNPVAAAGVYVPGARGGKTPLISTVLMTAIPAKIAGYPFDQGGRGQPPFAGGGQKGRDKRCLQGGKRLGHRGPGIRYRDNSQSGCYCRTRKCLCYPG